MNMVKEIDYTAMSTFLRCHKRYWWRFVRELVPKGRETAKEFGKGMHSALDEWYRSKDVEKAYEVFRMSYVEDPSDEKRTYQVARKMLQYYDERYRDQSLRIVASEQSFCLPIPECDVLLIGRIDKIADWDGPIYVVDHKTTGRLGAEYFYKIKPNLQFDGYIWAARQLGYPTCSGIIMDALLVAKGLVVAAQAAKLTPVARDTSIRSEVDIERYLNTIRQIIKDIEGCYLTDVWYENAEGCCDFGQCPYRQLCKEEPNVAELIAKSDYKTEKWDPRDGEKK